jgi:hypothetical protein
MPINSPLAERGHKAVGHLTEDLRRPIKVAIRDRREFGGYPRESEGTLVLNGLFFCRPDPARSYPVELPAAARDAVAPSGSLPPLQGQLPSSVVPREDGARHPWCTWEVVADN